MPPRVVASPWVRKNEADASAVAGVTEQCGDNRIRTTKYTAWSLVPYNLFEQFHRLANTYFLALVVLNWIPQLNVFGKEVSMLPLLLVLSTTLVKDAYEDWRRGKSDKAINNRRACVVRDGVATTVTWKEIRVGDIVMVRQDEEIPADLVLLSTTHADDSCFVSTMNLDGETNLKQRRVIVSHSTGTGLTGMHFTVRCEGPGRDLINFSGHVELHGDNGVEEIAIEPSHLALRGTVLRNTKHVTGVVIYAGMESKVMLNARAAPSKRSKLERSANWDILALIMILLALCLAGAIGARNFESSRSSQSFPYFPPDTQSPEVRGVVAFWQYIIVFQVMVPIALYITMEMVKLGQVYFIQQDLDLYDADRDIPVTCHALNITEDLGQVHAVFSDKTGTLTDNHMVLHSVSLGGVYLSAAPSTMASSLLYRGNLIDTMSDRNLEERRASLLRVMMLCNTVMVADKEGSDEKSFEGESPDEIALVKFAAEAGFVLKQREQRRVHFSILGRESHADILYTLPFDADRRRMSIVLRELDGTIVLLCKGADTSIFPLCDGGLDGERDNVHLVDVLTSDVNKFARAGLRTLVLAQRVLSEEEFQAWEVTMKAAQTSLTNRSALLAAAARAIEEGLPSRKALQVVGVTGVEDSLSSSVPQTIAQMQQAGMDVWVLTGDKMETAVNIGMASKVIPESAFLFQFEGLSPAQLDARLDECLAETRASLRTTQPSGHYKSFSLNSTSVAAAPSSSATSVASPTPTYVLVIDGASLAHALTSALVGKFMDLTDQCVSVVCCRSSPSQKAAVIAAYQSRHPDRVTVAVGDGANDVSMIQTAHVGIGICGKEGRQAAMASDFAVSSFRFLAPLLFVHGHWCYSRLARMLPYFLYKNAVFVFLLFWFQLYCGYSTQSALNDWNLILFSFIYTSVPVILSGILDQDVDRAALLRFPQLYKQGMSGALYTRRVFWLSCIADSLWQSLAMFYVPFLAYARGGVGNTDIGLYEMGAVMMTAAVVIVTVHLAIDTYHWTWIMHAGLWGSVAVYFFLSAAYATSANVPDYYEVLHVAGTPLFWLIVLLSTVVAVLPRWLVRVVQAQIGGGGLVHRARMGSKLAHKRSSTSVSINLLSGSDSTTV